MSGNDNLNETQVNVGALQVNGTATANAVFQGISGTPYLCDTTRTTLAGNGEYGSGSGQVANTLPTFAQTGGQDANIVCDNSAANIFVTLPSVNLAINPNSHPLRGRTVTVSSTATSGSFTINIASASTGSGNAAPKINGAANGTNYVFGGSGTPSSKQFTFDGLNWWITASF